MQRILVGLDGSPLAETILPFVEMLARKVRARVTLLHVSAVPDKLPRGGEEPIEQLVREATERAERYLRAHQRRLAVEGIETSVAVVAGQPSREIVRHAEGEGFDLVALATHGRSGLLRWAHGSVADVVLHTTSIPLLLVRPDDGWAAAPRGIEQIVVALDGSPEAEGALRLAEPLALRWGVPLVLVRFVDPVLPAFGPDLGDAAYADLQAIFDGTVEEARAYLDEKVAVLRGRGVAAGREVSVALPADGIAACTSRHPASLVVLTTHGRSGWRRLLLGSVARRVIHAVAAPLIVCPPHPAKAP